MSIDRLMFNLIQGLLEWEENEFKVVPKRLHEGLLRFIYHCAKANVTPPVSLPELIEILQQPVSSWGIDVGDFFPTDVQILNEQTGLSLEAREYIDQSIHEADFEQRTMKKILIYCRKHQLEESYLKIRTFLSDRQHAVLPFYQLNNFFGELVDQTLIDLVRSCYEEVPNLSLYKQCPNCGWTLSFKKGVYVCSLGNTCRYLVDYKEAKPFQVNEHVKYYRMTEGIQRYTLLPGLSEFRIARQLKALGFTVTMYPKIDAYDILAKKYGKALMFDVKDHTHPLYFAQSILKDIDQEKFIEEVYYMIPHYRTEIYHHYVKTAQDFLRKHTVKKIRILTEKELTLKKVGELLDETDTE